MRINQKGFTVVEGLLIVVAVLVLGFGGYYVWNENQKDNSLSSAHENSEQKSGEESELTDEQVLSNYESSELGVKFSYPTEWGQVILDKDPKDPLVSGKDYYLSFTNKDIQATFRSKDYETLAGRGSIYYDSPVSFSEIDTTTEYDFDKDAAFAPYSRRVYKVDENIIITGQCEGHGSSVSIDAYINVNTVDFDVGRFYIRLSEDVVEENCDDNLLSKFKPKADEFIEFVKSIQSV